MKWNPVIDADGNPNLPSDDRPVLVFLCGLLASPHLERPADAGYGLREGWFDHDRRMWRAGGQWEKYVTHWMECPPPPMEQESAASSTEVDSDATRRDAMLDRMTRNLRNLNSYRREDTVGEVAELVAWLAARELRKEGIQVNE